MVDIVDVIRREMDLVTYERGYVKTGMHTVASEAADEIIALRTQLAAAKDATIDALRDLQSARWEISLLHAEQKSEVALHRARCRQDEASAVELKADLVWAVKDVTGYAYDGSYWLIFGAAGDRVEYDGTPDGLCAAVRAARKGEK